MLISGLPPESPSPLLPRAPHKDLRANLPPTPNQGDGVLLSIAVGASGGVQEGLPQAGPIPGVDVHFNMASNQHDGKEGLGRVHFPKQNTLLKVPQHSHRVQIVQA